MKKAISVLLIAALLLSLTACGGGVKTPETTQPAPSTEAPTEPETEPTLSPEEILIESLPEKVREAYDLGIVGLDVLEDLDRVCLGREAADMVQRVHVLHHGKESKIMNQLLESEHAGLEMTRFWLALTMHAAEAEFLVEAPSDDYQENLKYMLTSDEVWQASYGYFYPGDGSIPYIDEEKNTCVANSWALPVDWEEACDEEQGQLFIDHTFDGSNLPLWVLSAYDRRTGEKVMSGSPEEPFRPREKMTVREVVETVLRYYNWIPLEQVLLTYEELPTYDTTIITSELLNKETTLPEASCQNLPASWHGIDFTGLYCGGEQMPTADAMLQENEIQVIKDAGFNFLRLHLDFKYFSSDAFSLWPGWVNEPQYGYMNETRLKEIDQIIAWCVERDIHLNLVGDGFIGWNPAYPPPFRSEDAAKKLACQWAVFARRYADIPNTYLSFTLQDEPGIYTRREYGKFFIPSVEAIRAASPERCIIADMGGRGDPGGDMAALGVALSTKVRWPEAIHLEGEMSTQKRNAFFESAAWPYAEKGGQIDAEAALANKRWNCDTVNDVAAVAEEYGVGFMVSGWAPTWSYPYPFPRERFSDEFMDAYLGDFTRVLAARGYGWCYGDSNGFVGLFSAYPAVNSTTYTQVGNAPLYIDEEMMARFRGINGVE